MATHTLHGAQLVHTGAPRHFAWQLTTHTLTITYTWHVAYNNFTSTVVLRVRRGTHDTVWRFAWAGVAHRGIHRRFAWQAWDLVTFTFVSRGRRGTNSHPPSFCVAGVGQMALGGALGPAWAPVTPRHFAWQAWHNLTSTFDFTWQAWHKLTSTVVLRGRRGTDGTGWRAWAGLGACDAVALCVAGVAQPDIHLGFTWQAWHKLTSTVVLRGRRGTHGTGWRAWAGLVACDAAALCVAGVAQTDIHLRFAWQAWHKLTSTVVLRGRRGHSWYWVARLGRFGRRMTPRHFAWQAWHNLTSTFVLRGRRGTNSHPPSFCVAGVALMALGGALGPDLVACDAAALCVAGVAQPDIHLRFTWQAWHKLTSTVVLRGRRGTDGTGWRAWAGLGACDAAALCVAGVAQPDIHLRFTWQAWHKVTSTFVLRGRRGTDGILVTIFHTLHTPSFTHRHSFGTHHLSHTTLSHAIFHTQLCHAPTLSHTIFHTPTLSHTIFHTPLCHKPPFIHHLSHITLSHTIFHRPSFTHHFVTYHL